MNNKILTKKEQIEIIIDRTRKLSGIIKKMESALDEPLETFDFIYDIGYEIIPAILGLKEEDFEPKKDVKDDILYNVLNGIITKEDFFKQLDKLLMEDK